MKRVLIPGVILCGADVAQAVDDKNMYMHVFEEMTVYAPVPVPVNGNTHYTSESIERLPTGNGNISDLLRTNPAVRMDSTQSTSLNQGDIRPEKISIHGASPYQNAYLIDGISATNNLNPANESDASSATNISGMSQGYYLDVSLLDNVTLYDSFVPVEFGRFNGGVIDAKIKRFNADDSSVKLGYRTTRSDWLTSHIDENNKSAFNQGSSGSTYYSPDFKKNFYTLSFNQELADNFGVTAGLSRRQSDITRADYVSNDGIVAGRAQYKNVIDTALSKFTWFASDRFTHDLTLKYTGSSRDYNTSTFPESDREMGNKSYGLAWDMDTQLAWAKLRTTVGWDHISDYTRHDHDIWYTELSCTYGDISGRCTRGGLGHISQAVDNYTFKTRLDWQKFTVGNVSHQPYFGAEYIYSDAWTERHNQSESYVINAAGKKTNHTIYHKGKGSLGIDNYTLYMADRISWRNVSLMPGVRYDYDNYLSNHNISPRFMTEWDIFADQTSMITAGYNRYYGGNILDMGLRDIRNSWTESVSGNKTLTRYQDLKTPYNDELAMGLQQKIGKNVIARANYVYREAHDQISKSSRTDSATKTTITEYNNDGKTKTHSFNLSFELAEPLHISQVDINPQIVFSYIKSKGNLSLNNGYEESNTGDNRVVYNGNLVSYDSVPVADFNNPLKISLNMDFTHQPSGLVWANTLTWQEARKARIILGKMNAQYISEYSDYKQYVDEKLDSSLTWDTRLSWTPQFLKQQNLTISADILNVLDSKTAVDNHLRFNIINDKENRVNGIALYYRLPMVQVNDEQSFIEQAEWSMLVQLFNQRLQERIQSGELKTISGGTARSVKIAPDYQSLFFRVNARDDNMQDAANALMAELATIDQHGFSAEELDDVKSTRLTWLKNAVDQQAERDLRMLTSRLASSSLNNTPFLSPEETYQLSKRLWQQITVQSLAEKWQQLRKNQDAFWEQMVNNEVAAKKALSPAAILALEKEYANKKLAAYIFPGRNLSLTVDADPQAEISSKETLAENLTSLTLSNGARVILAKSAGEEQKLQIIAVSNKGDLSFPAQQKSLIALANKAVSGSGIGELSSSSLKRWSAENSVTMSSKVSGMNTLLSVSVRTNNPEPGFQLINQRITHSTINDNIWASLQNAQIQALKTLDQRPAEKFAQQMYETRYADDRTKLPQENQIAQFTAADALAADRQLFSSPADITFVIVGNVAEDKLVALITRYLGSIKHSDSPLAAGKPLTRATDNASVTVKEQNEPVAQVSQWKRYNSRTPVNLATRMALDAFNVALAKDLRINIREQASGAYSVSSRLSVDPQAKDISHLLAFTCQPERHDELLTLANEVMVKRLAKGISEQELNEYQQNVQRSLDIQQRSVQQLANTIVNSLIQYDDPAAWIEQEQLLKQMTVENVNTAVKQYLSHPVNTYTGVLLPK